MNWLFRLLGRKETFTMEDIVHRPFPYKEKDRIRDAKRQREIMREMMQAESIGEAKHAGSRKDT